MIFTNDISYCNGVYAVEYMVVTWDIYCDWAITIYEIGMIMALVYYIYLSVGGYDHFHMGFHSETLKAKEFARIEKYRLDHEKSVME